MSTKKCPFCAEEIQQEAVKCKHCGEFLDQRRGQKAERPWYFRDMTVISMHLLLLFLALPLVWFNPYYSRQTKIIVSVLVVVLSWGLGLVMSKAVSSITNYYSF
jgi:hypothetical protein